MSDETDYEVERIGSMAPDQVVREFCFPREPLLASNARYCLGYQDGRVDGIEWAAESASKPRRVTDQVRKITIEEWEAGARAVIAAHPDAPDFVEWVEMSASVVVSQGDGHDDCSIAIGGLGLTSVLIWASRSVPPTDFDLLSLWVESLEAFETRVQEVRAALDAHFGGVVEVVRRLFYCASENCPGGAYGASDRRHPELCKS